MVSKQIDERNLGLRKPNSLLSGLDNDIEFSNQLHNSHLVSGDPRQAPQLFQVDLNADTRQMVNNSTADR